MNGTLAVMRYTLIELSRRRILLVFFIVGAVGLALLGAGLKLLYANAQTGNIQIAGGGSVTPEQMNRMLEFLFVQQLLGVLSIFALLIAFGIGMTAIYHDLESGAAVSIFSKPVSRVAFTAGKLLAAIGALVVIVGLLAIEARLVMALFGGGLENALTVEMAAVVANMLIVMLIVLALSTSMNNIIAVVVAFIYNQVIAGVIIFVHTAANAGSLGNDTIKVIFDGLYWLVPHPLTSSAVRDLATAQIEMSGARAGRQFAGLPQPSDWHDIAWWAFLVCLLGGAVYYSVRRRQV